MNRLTRKELADALDPEVEFEAAIARGVRSEDSERRPEVNLEMDLRYSELAVYRRRLTSQAAQERFCKILAGAVFHALDIVEEVIERAEFDRMVDEWYEDLGVSG